jgi:choline dehydrogenase-like flavoprotein
MRVIVVGSGAGGATVARELKAKGFEVLVLEAGREFKPFTRRLSWTEPLRRVGLLGSEKTITRLFPHLDLVRSGGDLVLIRGITTGGSTVLSCGNIVRAEHGLNKIGLDLTPEFEELEDLIGVRPFPQERWRPLTRQMFKAAKQLGLNPQPTPKAVDTLKCTSCGLCELGCASGARWDSRIFLEEALARGAELQTSSPVQKVIIENGEVKGVLVGSGSSSKTIKGDIVILAAGGIGTAQILKVSGLKAEDHLWSDIVITLGGVTKGANQLLEPPMVWYTKAKDYILSPYLDILSHWFHKPWRNVPIHDRVGVMVKLADAEEGSVSPEAKVHKVITSHDHQRLDEAVSQAKELMKSAGVSGPYVKGLPNAGHLGGTVPLKTGDISSMKPLWLPEGLWVADLSLVPHSQGLPTILTTAAVALRVSRKIVEES